MKEFDSGEVSCLTAEERHTLSTGSVMMVT